MNRGEKEPAVQPWASYYFASQNPVLFQDERNSALAKYDPYVLPTRGVVSHARQQEQSLYEHLGSHAESWEGLCNAWSYASVIYPW